MCPQARSSGGGASTPNITAPRHRVEAQEPAKQKRGGNRGRGRRSTVRRIDAAAKDRQAAWKATRQRPLTEALTDELNGLYDDLRDERSGADPGPHLHTSQAVARWKSEDTR